VSPDGFQEERAARKLQDGIGHITRIGASTGLRPAESAELMNAVQRFVVEQTRLGIPVVVHEESTAGYCARDATMFPQAIGLAATWDPQLVEEVAAVIREQLRAVGARHTLAPVLDIARDPRWVAWRRRTARTRCSRARSVRRTCADYRPMTSPKG